METAPNCRSKITIQTEYEKKRYACEMNPWQICSRFTLLALLLVPLCAAQTGFSALYSFTGQNADGAEPNGVLAIGKTGVLYGTTAGGGSGPCNVEDVPTGCGTVFELTPPSTPGGIWTETVLYRFAGQDGDGWSPYGGVVIGAGGRLFGTTLYGGIGCGSWGCGTVFELTPPQTPGASWTERIVHAFTGQNGDGAQPAGSLALGANGELYGFSTLGGSSGYGVVYELMPPSGTGESWTESTIHSFAFASFTSPQAYPADNGLIIGSGGVLYGATPLGGRSGYGMVFGLIPPKLPGGGWTETELLSFNQTGGISPLGGVIFGPDGMLYGSTYAGGGGLCSTYEGCGTVFQLAPSSAGGNAWQETVICELGVSCGGPWVAVPETNLVMGGNGVLYGTSPYALFALRPPKTPGDPWTAQTIYNFNSAVAGIQPSGLAINSDGVLFGTTLEGGLCGYCGTVFRWAPPAK